jgi:hypothetical protein
VRSSLASVNEVLKTFIAIVSGGALDDFAGSTPASKRAQANRYHTGTPD